MQSMVGQLFHGIDSETLLAVPFFLLVGELMASSDVAHRMIRLSQTLVGHLRGGLAQVVTLFSMLIALGLTDPRRVLQAGFPKTAAAAKRSARIIQTKRDYRPLEIVREPVFWVMYVMFVLVAAGGLMATAQLAPIAKDFKIADIPVSILGLTLPALTFALTLDRVLNGLTRPFFGWVSDHIGRELTMLIAFTLEGIGILFLFQLGQDPVMFVILSGLVFFAWGEIYSLFPSTNADTFGSKFAAANAGLLYTAKGTAALLVPLSSVLTAATGNWHAVFMTAAIMNIAAALLAWFVLRPMRRAVIEASASTLPPVGGGPRPQAA